MSTLLPGFQSLSNLVIRKFCTAMPTSQIIFLLTCLLLVPMLHESTLNYHKLEDTFSLAKNTTVKYYNKVKKKTTPLSENLSNTVWQIHVWPLSVNHWKVPVRKMAISFASFLSTSQNNKFVWPESSEQPGASSDLYPGPQVLLTMFSARQSPRWERGKPSRGWASTSRPWRPYSSHTACWKALLTVLGVSIQNDRQN